MRILVFNAGSSSLKFGVFDLSGAALGQVQECLRGTLDRFSPEGCELKLSGQTEGRAAPRDLAEAAAHVPDLLAKAGLDRFDAIAHRIAHGGERFDRATRLDGSTLDQIRALTPLAPLAQPRQFGGGRDGAAPVARSAAMGRVRHGLSSGQPGARNHLCRA